MLAHEIPNSQEFNQPVARNWVVNFYQYFLKVVSFSYQNNRGKMVLPIWTIKMCRGKRWECCVPKFFPPFDASIDGLRQFWRWAKKHVNKKQPQLLKPNQSCNTNRNPKPHHKSLVVFRAPKSWKKVNRVSFFLCFDGCLPRTRSLFQRWLDADVWQPRSWKPYPCNFKLDKCFFPVINVGFSPG